MNKPSILVVGSINMDLTVSGVPQIAQYGESVFCKDYQETPGGKGANQAVAAARLGADVSMVGHIGDDRNGRILLDNLMKNGVDVKDVLVDSKTQTGMANILVDGGTGKYTCYVVLGGNDRIVDRQVETALERRKYDMVLMQLEMPLETVYRTFELASKKGVPVFLDAGPAMEIDLERLNGIFLISPNESETAALTGILPDSMESAEKAAKLLFQLAKPQYVLLKLGSRGAFLYDGKISERIPCYTEIKAVDSTAAGDTFGAAFAVRYCMGADIRSSVQYAHAAAGICVSQRGAQSSIPDANEVARFLNSRKEGAVCG